MTFIKVDGTIIYTMEMPYSFEKAIHKSLESKQPIEVEIIDKPVVPGARLKCPDPKVQEIIDSAISERGELLYMFGQQITSVNEHPKFTRAVFDCTVLVGIGKEHSTGKQISFMSHSKIPVVFNVASNYWASLPKEEREKINMGHRSWNEAENPKDNLVKYEDYEHLLESALVELRNRCEPDTIDVIIVGGQILEKIEKKGTITDVSKEKIEKAKAGYERSVDALKAVTASVLGIEARVAHPPITVAHDTSYSSGVTSVLDTKNRKFYGWIVY